MINLSIMELDGLIKLKGNAVLTNFNMLNDLKKILTIRKTFIKYIFKSVFFFFSKIVRIVQREYILLTKFNINSILCKIKIKLQLLLEKKIWTQAESNYNMKIVLLISVHPL